MGSKTDAGSTTDRQSDYEYFTNVGLFSEGELINSYSDHGSVEFQGGKKEPFFKTIISWRVSGGATDCLISIQIGSSI